MKTNSQRNFFHWAFELGIFLKGLNGLFEILGGLLLYFIPTVVLNNTFIRLTQMELAEDPHDVIANAIVHFSQSLSASTKLFGAFYLLLHGIIKIGLVGALFKERFWAYPASILFLVLFISYQIYRLYLNYTSPMLILTIFDFIIVGLIWHEYRHIKLSD